MGLAASLASEAGSQAGDFPSALLASDLNSGFLAQYGLDGPLGVYPDDGPEDDLNFPMGNSASNAGNGSGLGGDNMLDIPPMPSVTSIATRKKRKEEMKQATIKQHYYPEGGWGYIVLVVAVLVQIMTHGLQLSYGITMFALLKRWPRDTDFISASKKSSHYSTYIWVMGRMQMII